LGNPPKERDLRLTEEFIYVIDQPPLFTPDLGFSFYKFDPHPFSLPVELKKNRPGNCADGKYFTLLSGIRFSLWHPNETKTSGRSTIHNIFKIRNYSLKLDTAIFLDGIYRSFWRQVVGVLLKFSMTWIR